MTDVLLIAAAILPGILIAWWVYGQDHYEPEPPRMLIRAFAAGCISTLPALLIQLFFQNLENPSSLIDTAIFAFFVVGFTEEFSKFLLLRWSIYPSDEFNEPMDGIVYGVMVSMGFATLENVMYVLNTEGGFSTALGRALTAIPAHAAFGVLMGAYVGLAKFSPDRRDAYMVVGVLLAAFFHGLYDFFLLQKVYEGVAILAIGALVWGIHLSRKLIVLGQEMSPFHPNLKTKKVEQTVVEQTTEGSETNNLTTEPAVNVENTEAQHPDSFGTERVEKAARTDENLI